MYIHGYMYMYVHIQVHMYKHIPRSAKRSLAECLLLFPDEGLRPGAARELLSDTSLPLFTSSRAGVEGGGTLSSSVSILVGSCSVGPPPVPPPPPFSFGDFFLAVEPGDLAGGFPFFF